MSMDHLTIEPADQTDVGWSLNGKLSDNEPMREIHMDHSPFRVGRRNGIGMTIPSPTVSGLHAEFSLVEDGLTLRDLSSTNGTFVNGVRIRDACKLNNGDLVQFADIVFRVNKVSAVEEINTICEDARDRALSLIQFDKLIVDRAVLPFFQPIVNLEDLRIEGYEILARSRLYGLTNPKAMFHAAALLNLEAELSRILRAEGVVAGESLSKSLGMFVNTHPSEMDDPELLILSLRELRDAHPDRSIVLEIHERSVTRPTVMHQLKAALSELEIRLAYDDFGAGQARLVELIDIPPDFLKFDIKLVKDIEHAPPEQRNMLRGLVSTVRSIGVTPLAEGVETRAAHEICCELGFGMGQGFLYGRPAMATQYVGREHQQLDES